MCRHMYDWNIVNCDVKQPIYLTLLTWHRRLLGNTLTDIKLWLKVLHNPDTSIWIKSTYDITFIKSILNIILKNTNEL